MSFIGGPLVFFFWVASCVLLSSTSTSRWKILRSLAPAWTYEVQGDTSDYQLTGCPTGTSNATVWPSFNSSSVSLAFKNGVCISQVAQSVNGVIFASLSFTARVTRSCVCLWNASGIPPRFIPTDVALHPCSPSVSSVTAAALRPLSQHPVSFPPAYSLLGFNSKT